jgi:hypothetical protein
MGNCPNLTTTTIYYTSSDNSVIVPNNTPVKSNIYENGVGELVVYGSMEYLPYDMFYNCTTLTGITLPDNLTVVSDFAFQNCTSLQSVTIPQNVTKIGRYAFDECHSLTSINIPSGVTTIGDYAFLECDKLKSVYCESITPPTLGYSIFNSTSYQKKIYVPTQSVDAYKSAKGWSTYSGYIVGYNF